MVSEVAHFMYDYIISLFVVHMFTLRKSLITFIFVSLTFCFSVYFATSYLSAATLPMTFGYQGFLTNSSGVVQTGTSTMTVRIYDAPSGGVLLFEENEGDVPVVKGSFSLRIGNVGDVNATTTAVKFSNLLFDQPYYITVELGSPFNTGEMKLSGGVRASLHVAPYAITSYGAVTATSSEGLTTSKGKLYYDTTQNQLFVNNGSTWQALGIAGSGITTLNGLSGLSQLFTISNTGSDVSLTSSGNTHTLAIPDASTSSRGVISTTTQTIAGDKTLTGITSLATTNITKGTVTDLTSASGTITNLISTNSTSTSGFFSLLTSSLANLAGLVVTNSTTTNATSTNFFSSLFSALASVINTLVTGTSTVTNLFTVTGISNLATTTASNLSLLGSFFDSTNVAGTLGQVLLSTGTSTQWVATSSLGISGSGGVIGGVLGYATRWITPTMLGTSSLLDDGVVTGINATSSNYSFNVQGKSGTNPFNVASSTGTSLFTILQNGNVGVGTTVPHSKLEVTGPGYFEATSTNAGVYDETVFGIQSTNYNNFSNRELRVQTINTSGIYNQAIIYNGHLGGTTDSPIYIQGLYGRMNGMYFNNGDVNFFTNTGPINQVVNTDITATVVNALTIQGSTGNVGIGTTNPQQKLDVNGTVGINGTQIVDASRNLTNIGTIGAGNIIAGTYNGQTISSTANFTGSLAMNGVFANTSGVSSYFTGKVGIGTTVPNKLLHIKGAEAGIFLEETTGGADNEAYLVHYDNIFTIQNRTSAGAFVTQPFSLDIRAPNGTFQALQNGNVGIGTTNPQQKLDVNGTVGINGTQIIDASRNLTNIGTIGAGNITAGTYNGQTISSTANFTGSLAMNGAFTNTSASNSYFTGNVGIGTSTPQQKLTVVGGRIRIDQSDGIGKAGVLELSNGTSTSYLFTGGGNDSTLGDLYLYPSLGKNIILQSNNGVASGNVGIGTSTPTSLLSVSSSTANGTSNLFSISTSTSLFNILANGNVGIGTTNPGNKLDVVGTIQSDWDTSTSLTQQLFLKRLTSGSFDGTSLSMDTGMGQGLANIVAGASINSAGTGYTYNGTRGASRIALGDGSFQIFTGALPSSGGQSAGSAVTWSNGGNPAIAIDNAGNVGIGTVGPGALLDVNKSRATTIGGITYDAAARIQNSYTNGARIVEIGNYGWNNYIQSYDGGSTYSPLLLGPMGGNIGIGTLNPQQKLDVNGTVGINGTQIIDSSRNLTNIGTIGAGNIIAGTYNGQTISSTANFTGSLAMNGAFSNTSGVSSYFTGNVGIGATTPSNTLSFGNTQNQTIGVENTTNIVAGKGLAIKAGSTVNTAPGGVITFTSLGQTNRNWWGLTVAPNGNVYAATNGGDIYVQTGGVGNFIALGQTNRSWYAMAAAPNGNVYAAANGGDIYMQTGGTGNFIALGQTNRSWWGLTVAPNGNVYAAVYNGDIYMQTGGVGNFVALGQTIRGWIGVAAAPNGNVYACDPTTNIYMQTGGTGNFVAIGPGGWNWFPIAVNPATSDVWVAASSGDIYKQTGGIGSFVATGQTGSRAWRGLTVGANGNVYATDMSSIYMYTYVPAGGTPDLAGGNLSLSSGQGKGVGASTISFLTGTPTASTSMQTLTEKLTILGNGNIGIGTTTPDQKLTVSGGSIIIDNNQQYSARDSAGTARTLLLWDSSNIVHLRNNALGTGGPIVFESKAGAGESMRIDSTGNVGIGTTTLNSLFSISSSTANGTSNLFSVSTSTSLFNILANGNVGIGTTNPTNKLTVSQASGNLLVDINNLALSTSYSGIRTLDNGTERWFLGNDGVSTSSQDYTLIADAARIGFSVQRSTGNMTVGTRSSFGSAFNVNGGASIGISYIGTTAPSNGAIIQGNVGIGTTSPTSLLSVSSSTANGTTNLFSVSTSTSLFNILANGNVGIGTTTPTAPLYITSTNDGILQLDQTGGLWNYVKYLANGMQRAVAGVDPNENYFVGVYDSNSVFREALTVASSTGNIGIGTTNPIAQLQLGGNYTTLQMGSSATATDNFHWVNENPGSNRKMTLYNGNLGSGIPLLTVQSGGNVGIGTISPVSTLSIQGTAGTNPITIASSTGASLFTILQNGNVGIGTTSPLAKLQIENGTLFINSNNGTAQAIIRSNSSIGTMVYPQLLIENYSNDGGFPVVELAQGRGTSTVPLSVLAGDILGGFNTWGNNGTSRQSATRIQGIAETTFSSSIGAGLQFFTTTGGSQSEKMRILGNGNVGIGTTTPTDKLQIAGNTTPSLDATYSLGSSTLRFLNLFTQNIFASSSVITNATSTNIFATLFNAMTAFIASITATDVTVTNSLTVTGTSTLATTTASNLSLLGSFFDSTNVAGTLGQVLLSTGTSTQWVATSSLGISGGSGVIDGVLGYATRWITPTMLGTSSLLDDGVVAGINATSSNYSFNVQGKSGTNPFNVASSTGTSLFTILQNGNVGIGTTTPGSALDVKGTLRLSGATSGYVGFAPAAAAGSTTYTLPSADGTAGQVLSTNASGVLSWANAGSGSSQWTTTGTKIYYNTGNVGIGTTAPGSPLEVNGNIASQSSLGGRLELTHTSSGTSNVTGQIYSSNSTTQLTAMVSGEDGANNSGYLRLYTRNTGSWKDVFYANHLGNVGIGTITPGSPLSVNGSISAGTYSATAAPSNGMIISGNVGIGTTGPSQKLQVMGSIALNDSSYISGGSTAGYTSFFTSGNNAQPIQVGGLVVASGYSNTAPTNGAYIQGNVGIGTTSPVSTLSVQGTAGTNPLTIASSTGTSLFSILANGNVGIGTTNPLAKLDVTGSSGTFNYTEDSTAQVGALINPTGTAGKQGVLWLAGTNIPGNDSLAFINDSNTTSGFVFATRNGATTGARMVITSAGNVGIGTTTPAKALQVIGDIRIGTAGTNGCLENFSGGTIAGTGCVSDQRLKDNVTDISNVVDKISSLRVINYNWNKTASDFYGNSMSSLQTGYLAQNVESLFPELISTNKEGFKQVNYSALSLYGIEGVKELALRQATTTKLLSDILSAIDIRNASTSTLTLTSKGWLGIGTTSPLAMLHVSNTTATGTVARFQNENGYCDIDPTTKSLLCTPDDALRINQHLIDSTSTIVDPIEATIATITSTLERITRLHVVTYNLSTDSSSSTTYAGLMLSEIQKFFPDIVKTDESGVSSFSLTNLIPYIIDSIKSLAVEISSMRTKFITDDFTAKNTVHTKTICVGENGNETCITKEKLDQLLLLQSTQPASASTGGSTGSSNGGTVNTPSVIVTTDTVLSDTGTSTSTTIGTTTDTSTGTTISTTTDITPIVDTATTTPPQEVVAPPSPPISITTDPPVNIPEPPPATPGTLSPTETTTVTEPVITTTP